MKKSILFLLLILFVSVGCNKATNKNLVEVWNLKKMTASGTEVPLFNSVKMELKDDNTGTYTIDTAITQIDSWSLDKKNQILTIASGSDVINYNIIEFKGGIMKLEVPTDSLVYIQEFEKE